MRICSSDGDAAAMRKGIVMVRVPCPFVLHLRVDCDVTVRGCWVKRETGPCAFFNTGTFLNSTTHLHCALPFIDVCSSIESEMLRSVVL